MLPGPGRLSGILARYRPVFFRRKMEDRVEKLEKKVIDIEGDVKTLKNDIDLLKSNFIGLNKSWSFVATMSVKLDRKIQELRRQIDKSHTDTTRLVVELIDAMKESHAKPKTPVKAKG
jgi:chromosome segregation ATPase